jgi:hypothetical protein
MDMTSLSGVRTLATREHLHDAAVLPFRGALPLFNTVQIQLAFVVDYSQLHLIEPSVSSQYISSE